MTSTLQPLLAELPALTAPAGFHQGLPVGFQLIGGHLEEYKLLHIAHQLQQVTDFHQQHPADFDFEEG